MKVLTYIFEWNFESLLFYDINIPSNACNNVQFLYFQKIFNIEVLNDDKYLAIDSKLLSMSDTFVMFYF